MAQPFQRVQVRSSRIGRALGGRRTEVAGALEDVLAEAVRVRDVRRETIWGVCAARGVDVRQKLRAERRSLYKRYLEHCLEDRALSAEETTDLFHLRSVLHLSEADVTEVHDTVARAVYGNAVDEVLEDLKVDGEEKAFLRELRETLRLPEREAETLLELGAARARVRALSEASSPDREFLEYRAPAGEFTGRSADSLEAAISDALGRASLAIPQLHWFEVSRISGYVGEGNVSGWHVSLRAGIRVEETGAAR